MASCTVFGLAIIASKEDLYLSGAPLRNHCVHSGFNSASPDLPSHAAHHLLPDKPTPASPADGRDLWPQLAFSIDSLPRWL